MENLRKFQFCSSRDFSIVRDAFNKILYLHFPLAISCENCIFTREKYQTQHSIIKFLKTLLHHREEFLTRYKF